VTAFLALVAKELRALFVSPIAYAVIAVFLVLNGYGFAVTLFATKQATLVNVFFQAAVQLVLFVPLVTMRQFAEERRGGTLELLLTAPVREGDIVLAKFAASMGMLLAMVALTLVYAGVLARFSTPDWGPIYSGYLGLVLLAGALVSIGLAVSALTAARSHQTNPVSLAGTRRHARHRPSSTRTRGRPIAPPASGRTGRRATFSTS